ncbi:MAG: 4-alpha-glucanotransferase [Ectothiorhodospiraceae bacterium]|nr:4-alpha-glucanotransferase [Ectothiorhodospiraceae bacterium]
MTKEAPCWLQERRAGVLLHPTSLPGSGPQGDLGPGARRFVDYLAEAGFAVWQMLPVGPVHDDLSPYRPRSSFAGHTGLLSAELLQDEGLIDQSSLGAEDNALPDRRGLVARAWTTFCRDADAARRSHYEQFLEAQSAWLPDYALFRTIGLLHGDRAWYDWPRELRTRAPDPLQDVRKQSAALIQQECFGQYLFFRQWEALKAHAHAQGVRLFGDLPIYVADDSADVWRWRDYFTVDETGRPREVAGVPPDAFSATGQRWGNPLYRWDRLAANGHDWWIERFRAQCGLFDLLRIDHFRGFESYWAVPAEARTAKQGAWREGPGREVFDAVFNALGPLQLVAEDLGDITPAVDQLRRTLGFPGMRVLQFGFEGDADNPHRPGNHVPESVVYTGTHDNDTTLGWWRSLSADQRREVLGFLCHPHEDMPRALVHAAMASVGRLAVVPMQDLLGLGSEARMNTPGNPRGNWGWRLETHPLNDGPEPWIRSMLASCDRLPPDPA